MLKENRDFELVDELNDDFLIKDEADDAIDMNPELLQEDVEDFNKEDSKIIYNFNTPPKSIRKKSKKKIVKNNSINKEKNSPKDEIQKEVVTKNILLREIFRKKEFLDRLECFVMDLEEDPELLLELYRIFPEINNEFAEDIKSEIQDLLYANLCVIDVFKNEKIAIDYDREAFPAKVKVLYSEMPIFLISIEKQEYKYLLIQELEKIRDYINNLDFLIEKNKNRCNTISGIKTFISQNYNAETKNFKDLSLAKEAFFKFYFDEKQMTWFDKVKFYLFFKKKQSEYIDEIFKIYDQANDNINAYENQKYAELEKLKHCDNLIGVLDIVINQIIALMLDHNYNIR